MGQNSYGLKMVGLRAASKQTTDYNLGYHLLILYNVVTGEILCRERSGNTYYQDEKENPNILEVCQATTHMTTQEIADEIIDAVRYSGIDVAQQRGRKKIDTHGLKMVGLKAASAATFDSCSSIHSQIVYNKKTGEISVHEFVSSREYYPDEKADPDIIEVYRSHHKMTMQEISDKIADAVANKQYEWV